MKCLAEKDNISLSKCNDLPAMIASMITTPANFKCTAVQSVDPAFWQDAIKAGKATRIYLWPRFVGTPENLSEEAIYEDGPLGILHVRDGNYRFRFTFKEALCFHKAMYSHRATSGRVFLFDVKNQLFGTVDEDDNFMGFSIQLLNTEKLMFSDGTVSTKSPIYLALANNLEIDQNGATLTAAFINTLQRLTDVELTVVSADAAEIVVDVKTVCDDEGVSGLIPGDFNVTETDGTEQVLADAVEDDDIEGRYVLTTGGAFVDGFVNLVSPANLSLDAYESTGVKEVDVLP